MTKPHQEIASALDQMELMEFWTNEIKEKQLLLYNKFYLTSNCMQHAKNVYQAF